MNAALEFRVQQQVHSYRNGHALAGSSIKLERGDQDLVDRLSDLAGPIGPGQTFAPYLTFYPLGAAPYYVVARTWQDLSAPRAGCVITRSFLVPIGVWRNGKVLSSLLAALEVEGRDLSRFVELAITPCAHEESHAFESSSTTEFVEAFFLEKRQPIVVFEAQSPEAFASRLIEGLWPAFRSSLAICTHAYSPRSIQGRPFDLLFAPASARSNFSAWAGRRIDGQTGNRQPRHKWTTSITQRLFGGTRVLPLAVSFGELDVALDEADESQFRLAMLWEELRQRSQESPLAILGMLDIVASLGQSEHSVSRLLGPTLRSSIRLAERLGTEGLFQYLVTLLGKFPSRLPPIAALSDIRRAARNATVQQPDEALAFLRERAEQGSAPPTVVIAGLADGLVKGQFIRESVDTLLSLDDESLLSLVGYGRKFASVLIDALKWKHSYEGLERLERLVATADVKLRSRARRNIIPFLSYGGEGHLLAELLRGVDGRTLSTSVRWLSASGAIVIPELGDALVITADSPEKQRLLRSLLTQLPQNNGVDAILAKAMTVAEDDLEWFRTEQFESTRASVILRDVLARSSDAELRRIPSRLADGALQAAHLEVADFPIDALIRILSLVPSSCDVLMQIALTKADYLAGNLGFRFVQLLLVRVLSETASHPLAVQVLNQFGPSIPARELALMAASPTLPTVQVSNNLMLFGDASESVRSHLASRADVLTEQIVNRRSTVPSVEAIGAWASLISEAILAAGEATSLRAASVALEFALSSTNVQVSPLLRVAFPRVYEHLRNSETASSMFSFFSFYDWDKCKIARKDLVSAFISSVWPPADLLRIADEVMEVESIHRILGKAPNGKEFLAQALADPSLPLHVRNAFFGVA
ncbi:hypothetical protein P3T43_000631 [Paraburkholderia sp. GAS41]|uniref:GAP1-N1 domain-containing protein n=1 Tax=Paraburkholderia sp. GAS41 TaxID=3035134 RepID=UPI003D1AA100